MFPVLSMISDPRCQPGAYITDGKHLCEVLKQIGTDVRTEDCKDGTSRVIGFGRLQQAWTLVRATPAAPDTIEDKPLVKG